MSRSKTLPNLRKFSPNWDVGVVNGHHHEQSLYKDPSTKTRKNKPTFLPMYCRQAGAWGTVGMKRMIEKNWQKGCKRKQIVKMHPNAIHQCSSFTVLCDGMHSKNACLLSILTDSVGVQSLRRCRESDLTLKHAKILAWPALWPFPLNHLTIDNKNAIWLKNGNTIWAEEWHAKSARSLVLSLSVANNCIFNFWVLNEFGAGFMVSEPPRQTGEEATEICYRKKPRKVW